MTVAATPTAIDLRVNRLRHLPNVLLLLCLAGLLFFWGLGSIGLTDRDEGRNAEAGREMFETGDWISPTFNYEPRYAKPVFLYWLMSASYRLFGVNEFAARFPSALFGMALILMQYLVLSRLRGPLFGLFGSLMLLLNIEVIALGRMALTDSLLIFFTTLSLYAFWLGLHGKEHERHWIWGFYVGMALATLTKGPVGVILPVVIAGGYLLLTKRWGDYWRQGFPLPGAVLLVVLAVPWYAAMLAIHGSDYTSAAQANTVGRFLSPMEGHGFSLFFYIPVLFLGFFPWSGLLPMALYYAVKDWRESRSGAEAPGLRIEAQSSASSPQPSHKELELFAAVWIVGMFLFFTLSSTRLPHYIGPLFPAAALLTASLWHRSLLEPATGGIKASIHTIMGLGYLLAIGFAAVPSFYSRFADKIAKEFGVSPPLDELVVGLYAAAIVLIIGMGMVGYFGLQEARRAGAFWAAGSAIALVALVAIQITLPLINRYVIAPPQELAFTAGLNLGQNDRLILYGPARPSSVFYARRKAIVIHPGEEENIRPYLAQPGRTMILLPARLKSQLPAEAMSYPTILQRLGYILVANEAMVKSPAGASTPSSGPPLRIRGH